MMLKRVCVTGLNNANKVFLSVCKKVYAYAPHCVRNSKLCVCVSKFVCILSKCVRFSDCVCMCVDLSAFLSAMLV